ncbi:MAG: hypothetical protein ACYS99_18640 [Planctomycetota bacterium]|jgi:hypothetical protein
MQSKLTTLSLVFAILALAISAYSLSRDSGPTRDGNGPGGSPSRLSALEERVDRIAREVDGLRGQGPGPRGLGIGVSDLPNQVDGGDADPSKAEGDRLKTMVDEAVEEKARSITEELRLKEDKEPSMKVFAQVLELTDEQRESTEREVIRGQGEVFGILDIATDDGRNLLDDLVESYATSLAKPDTDPGWWPKWLGRVITERIPGSSETYAVRIDAVKASMLARFREIFSKEQYAEFEQWGVDPIEIEDIEDSPGEALEKRIVDRARELGAKIPQEEED